MCTISGDQKSPLNLLPGSAKWKFVTKHCGRQMTDNVITKINYNWLVRGEIVIFFCKIIRLNGLSFPSKI